MSPNPSSSPPHSASTIPDPQSHLSDFLLSLQSALQPLTQSAALLPNNADIAFHKSIDRKLAPKLDAQADRLLDSISSLSSWVAHHPQAPNPPNFDRDRDRDRSSSFFSSPSKSSARNASPFRFKPEQLAADAFPRAIGDLVDHLLENADTCLDEYTGKLAPRTSKYANVATANTARFVAGALPKNGPLPAKILNAPITPPQRSFSTKPDNRPGVPWSRPLKLGKPHAQVPLGWTPPLEPGDESRIRGVRRGMYCAEGDPRDNPYHYEIHHTAPPDWVYDMPQPLAPPPLNPDDPSQSTDDTPYVWVDTAEKLRALLDHLLEDRVHEIAIDLEHHNYRTYQGIVCLLQLSTRWGDWIVDTLSNEVREHSETLNAAFADPRKVKVLHGANHDVLWLQRDLGLYLVNLFDTYHATNILNFAGHGLGYLMQRYCEFDADKRYQLADWRIRPLPNEMLYYARSDTHSLLYIYDSLRKEMLESPQGGGAGTNGGAAAIREVFELSKSVATAVYAKEDWDEDGEGRDGWRALWRKWGREAAEGSEKRRRPEDMHKEERLVRRLHQWRDVVAREEDESPHYVLRAASLMMLASRAPVSVPGVVASFSPAVPALRKRAPELAQVIKSEVEAWERDVKRKEKRIAQGLEGAVDGEEENGDVGETIERPPTAQDERMADVAIVVDDEPITAISAAAASDVSRGVNYSLWSAKASSSVAPSTSSSARGSLTSVLFGASSRGENRKSTSADPKPLTAKSTVGGLFSLTTTSTRTSTATKNLVASITSQFITDVAPVLGTHLSTDSDANIRETEQSSGLDLAQPETVAFVPRSERTTISVQNDDEKAEEEEEEEQGKNEIVNIQAGGKKKKRWTKEMKRARNEVVSTPSSDPASESVPTLKKIKTEPTSTSSSSGGKARKIETSFDFTGTESLLTTSTNGGKKGKSKKPSSKEGGRGGGGKPEERFGDGIEDLERETFKRQPKKKNEIRNAGRSGTFGR